MAAAGTEGARPADVVRSLLFYAVFYAGTLVFVLASLAGAAIGTRAVGAACRAWSRYHRLCMRALLGIRLDVRGTPPGRGVFIAMKHESFSEAIDLPALYDWPVVFAKAELLRIPLWGKAARIYGLVPVERAEGAKALREMIAAARAWAPSGRPYMIFPEGTRVPHGTRAPLQAGFAALYKLLGMPVVPVAINSGLLYHRRWKRPGTITVLFGEPIPPGLPRAEIEARVLAAINALNSPDSQPSG